jgi:hypothetical protein
MNMIISHKEFSIVILASSKAKGGSGPTAEIRPDFGDEPRRDIFARRGVPRPSTGDAIPPLPAFPRCLTGHNEKEKEVLLASLPGVGEARQTPSDSRTELYHWLNIQILENHIQSLLRPQMKKNTKIQNISWIQRSTTSAKI